MFSCESCLFASLQGLKSIRNYVINVTIVLLCSKKVLFAPNTASMPYYKVLYQLMQTENSASNVKLIIFD